jgi:hypothetical protein
MTHGFLGCFVQVEEALMTGPGKDLFAFIAQKVSEEFFVFFMH